MLFALYVEIVKAFWILFPAYAANCCPTFVRVYNIKGHSMDFGKSHKGNRILGDGKTWEGFAFGMIGGFLVGLAETGLFSSFNAYANVYGASLPTMNVLVAFLIPLGALTGDIVKSFFKRRLGLKRGANLMYFDQLDFVAGTILFTFLFIDYTLAMIALMFIATFLVHRISSIIGYRLKIKREPW